nr:C-reactive protein-like [Nerophis lumbriciformis]
MEKKGSGCYVSMVMAALILVEASGGQVHALWTTASPDLNGMMVTLSYRGGGVSFYPPNYSIPPDNTRAYPTRDYPTRAYPTRDYPTRAYPTSAYPSWTTESPPRGVSVCVRYLMGEQTSSSSIFQLSPSSQAVMRLTTDNQGSYRLNWEKLTYQSVRLDPRIKMWSNVQPDIWTRVCVTVDTLRGVAQLFSDSNMSVRAIIPSKFVWSGEPVVAMSGFDGQVTDLQVWDYPLTYYTILTYMNRWLSGSVLTWSNIGYSLTGSTILELTYERRQKKSASKKSRGRRPQKPRESGKNSVPKILTRAH